MTRKSSLMLCVLLLTLGLTACAARIEPLGKLGEMSRDDFMAAMRWKRYAMAAGLMQEPLREAFLKTFTEREELHVVDVRLVDLKVTDQERRFEASYAMDYYLLPSVTVKTFRFSQTWEYADSKDPTRQGFFIVTPFPSFP